MEPLLRHNGLLHYANHSVQSNPHTINYCTYAISWRLVYISLMILFTLLVFIFMFYLGCNVTFHM
ncbi:unnamed protein product [Cuscuta epithymum]|uniref:Uncharacterized protein n=1 Tax=Cuscuta epithymum TaxID=186058 RepID=A0AAV0G1Q6_9ASTE|nr:unnamed protein product [Cuscuta epithymum]